MTNHGLVQMDSLQRTQADAYGGCLFAIMRHGEAESGKGLKDFDRQLTEDGVNAAVTVGERLGKWGFEQALVSAAMRTRMTAAQVLPFVSRHGRCSASYHEELYNDSLFAVIETLDAIIYERKVLLIGHNPVVSQLVQWLTEKTLAFEPADAVVLATDMPLNAPFFASGGRGGWQIVATCRAKV